MPEYPQAYKTKCSGSSSSTCRITGLQWNSNCPPVITGNAWRDMSHVHKSAWQPRSLHSVYSFVLTLACFNLGSCEAPTSASAGVTLLRRAVVISMMLPLSSVQSLSRVWLFVTPWTVARQASLFINNSQSLLKLMSIESVMPSNHLIFCRPLLLLPSIFPSIRVFSNESVLRIRWPKYWSFSFNICPFNDYSGLISFRMDWLDLLAVQGTLKSFLKHHSSTASILQCSVFFRVQLSHPHTTTG